MANMTDKEIAINRIHLNDIERVEKRIDEMKLLPKLDNIKQSQLELLYDEYQFLVRLLKMN